MDKWVKREFINSSSDNPFRFECYNALTAPWSDYIGTYDFIYKCGEIDSAGTNVSHSGYWNPIEQALSEYDSDLLHSQADTLDANISEMNTRVDSKITALNSTETGKINTLNTKITTGESNLSKYAPKSGATFTNPKATFSPALAANDNSTNLATTEQVRAIVRQYPIPPKPAKTLKGYPLNNQIAIELWWTDPDDFVYDGMNLGTWQKTRIVYRTNRYPTNETDGTIAVDNTVRNQYNIQARAFVLSGLMADIDYYFSAFTCTDRGIWNRYQPPQTSEIILPYMQTLAPLSTPITSAAASMTGSGITLIGGGEDKPSYNKIVWQYYNGQKRNTINELSIGRSMLASATDGNGNVLFGGGRQSNSYNIVDKISNYTLIESVLEPLSEARSYLSACKDGNGNVLFAGGVRDATTDYFNTVDKYTKDGIHTVLPPLTNPKYYLASSMDGNGNALFGGGAYYSNSSFVYFNTVDKYTKDGIHTVLPPLTNLTSSFSAATDGNGAVLFGGGYTWINGTTTYYNTVDKYTKDGIHTVLPPLKEARNNLTACNTGSGSVIFAGGRGATGYKNVIDIYYPDGTKNSYYQSLSYARQNLTSSIDNKGNVIIAGGGDATTGDDRFSDVVDYYTIKE